MKEKSILFNTEMAQATLDGRKTQTRRVIKPAKTSRDAKYFDPDLNGWPIDQGTGRVLPCPYGKVGDLLWVRETWRIYLRKNKPFIQYRADGQELAISHDRYDHLQFNKRRITWRPSIFMPRWASRLTLRVADVRVERIQDITEQDAMAEGISPRDVAARGHVGPLPLFKHLWDTINAKRGYSWQSDPWVWAVKFELVTDAPDNE